MQVTYKNYYGKGDLSREHAVSQIMYHRHYYKLKVDTDDLGGGGFINGDQSTLDKVATASLIIRYENAKTPFLEFKLCQPELPPEVIKFKGINLNELVKLRTEILMECLDSENSKENSNSALPSVTKTNNRSSCNFCDLGLIAATCVTVIAIGIMQAFKV